MVMMVVEIYHYHYHYFYQQIMNPPQSLHFGVLLAFDVFDVTWIGKIGVHILRALRNEKKGVGISTYYQQVKEKHVLHLFEYPFEPIPGPLQCVLDLIGEILEGANWYALLGRVPCGAIVLGPQQQQHVHWIG